MIKRDDFNGIARAGGCIMVVSNRLRTWTTGCGCCHTTRRGFLTGCAGCAVTASALLEPKLTWAAPRSGGRSKVRVVFCQPKNDRPTWPNVGYDFEARERQIMQALTAGCPEVQFLPARMIDTSAEESGLLDRHAEVDGYIVCLLGLGWEYGFEPLCASGKPTLLVDNLYGGSGMFLTRTGRVMETGNPVDWLSTSRDEDLVAAARHFALLAAGRSPAEVAAAFRATRRQRCPEVTDWTCEDDNVSIADFKEALQKLQQTRLLVIGGGWGGDEFRQAAKNVTGVEFVPIAFEELAAAYEVADQEAAQDFADRWMEESQEVVEPTKEDIYGSGAMYVAMQALMSKHRAAGISINCLGGFYGGHLKAYPCLGFSHLNNEGQVGGCEADQMSALTMSVMGALAGRPGFISDPVIDTSKNQIIYAHCVAMTKPFGVDGPANPYRIRNHSEDRKGASIQSLLPPGYMTTTLEINPVTRQVLMHQAKTAGNNYSDMACRTKLEAYVRGDIEKLTENWRMGWHRVTFYGDLRETVVELSERWKLELIEEA